MISEIRIKQKEYSQNKSKESQKELGQYFTDSPIAQFMSSLIDVSKLNPENVKLLDCGAGHGMLTASTALFLLDNGINKIDATVYEIDNDIIAQLNSTLLDLSLKFQEAGKVFTYSVINENFVSSRPDLNSKLRFDVSVINPPYFKYSVKNSIYSKKTADLFKGDPNIYASFIALTLSLTIKGGQLVAITPRSFLNGLYFKGFRKYVLNNSKIDLIHIFKSRKDVFTDSKILQENIIFKITKVKESYSQIRISSCFGISDIENPTIIKKNKNIIIDDSNEEEIIRIPEYKSDFIVLQKAEKLPSSFAKEGYIISTGPVVTYRTQNYQSMEHKEFTVPLLKAHNVKIDGISWSGQNKKDTSFELLEDYSKHLIANTRYVILKRFTSKDEKRRLVAGVYNPIEFKDYIGISNKLNYIKRKDSILSEDEALGLSIIFNSEFMDNYYRCISGNTQVNSTDIRIMKIPERKTIVALGKSARNLSNIDYRSVKNLTKDIFNE